jgi:hypothetical protein
MARGRGGGIAARKRVDVCGNTAAEISTSDLGPLKSDSEHVRRQAQRFSAFVVTVPLTFATGPSVEIANETKKSDNDGKCEHVDFVTDTVVDDNTSAKAPVDMQSVDIPVDEPSIVLSAENGIVADDDDESQISLSSSSADISAGLQSLQIESSIQNHSQPVVPPVPHILNRRTVVHDVPGSGVRKRLRDTNTFVPLDYRQPPRSRIANNPRLLIPKSLQGSFHHQQQEQKHQQKQPECRQQSHHHSVHQSMDRSTKNVQMENNSIAEDSDSWQTSEKPVKNSAKTTAAPSPQSLPLLQSIDGITSSTIESTLAKPRREIRTVSNAVATTFTNTERWCSRLSPYTFNGCEYRLRPGIVLKHRRTSRTCRITDQWYLCDDKTGLYFAAPSPWSVYVLYDEKCTSSANRHDDGWAAIVAVFPCNTAAAAGTCVELPVRNTFYKPTSTSRRTSINHNGAVASVSASAATSCTASTSTTSMHDRNGINVTVSNSQQPLFTPQPPSRLLSSNAMALAMQFGGVDAVMHDPAMRVAFCAALKQKHLQKNQSILQMQAEIAQINDDLKALLNF